MPRLRVSRIGEAANPGPEVAPSDCEVPDCKTPRDACGPGPWSFRLVSVNVAALKPHTSAIIEQLVQVDDPTQVFFVQEHA
eukprot:536879-Alexandrium_andersonii.AAC.1